MFAYTEKNTIVVIIYLRDIFILHITLRTLNKIKLFVIAILFKIFILER